MVTPPPLNSNVESCWPVHNCYLKVMSYIVRTSMHRRNKYVTHRLVTQHMNIFRLISSDLYIFVVGVIVSFEQPRVAHLKNIYNQYRWMESLLA